MEGERGGRSKVGRVGGWEGDRETDREETEITVLSSFVD